jgi:hypothetical protein
MRWDSLFADIEGQWEAEDQAVFDADLAALTRGERGALSLVDRLTAQVGSELGWGLRDGRVVRATLLEVGPDWLLLRLGMTEVILPTAGFVFVSGMSGAADPARARLARRFRFTAVLRGLSQQRRPITAQLITQPSVQLTGTIDRVGMDHADVAIHQLDEPRRASVVSEIRCVVLGSISFLTVH